MLGPRYLSPLLLLVASSGCGDDGPGDIDDATASVVVVEPDWVQVLQVEPGDAIAATFNSADGGLYYGGRSSTPARRGLWSLAPDGTVAKIGGTTQVSGVAVTAGGDVFYADDFTGNVFRSAGGTATPELWVSGFHAGDDDPVGIAVAPADYVGPHLAPGELAIIDRGSGGPDEVWAFSSLTPEGERLIHPDNGTLVDGVDIAITRDNIYLADQGARRLYRLRADGSLERMAIPSGVTPTSLAVDPQTQELLLMDLASSSVLRFDPATGASSVVLSELRLNADNFASLDVSPDGTRIVVTERGAPGSGTITVFEFRPNTPPVAVCEDVVVEIGGAACEGDATVGAGSFDPDGDPIDIEVSTPGPYAPGETTVTVTVTDSEGASDSCAATVTVVQTATAWIAENATALPHPPRGRSNHGVLAFPFFGGGTAVFDIESAVFEAALDDSTARLSGTLRVRRDGAFGIHDGELWTVDLSFAPASDRVRPRGAKRTGADPSQWRFFRVADGSRMTRVSDGATAFVRPFPRFVPFAFQLGDGANGKNQNVGLSGSFLFKRPLGGRFFLPGAGRVSLDLTPVCSP